MLNLSSQIPNKKKKEINIINEKFSLKLNKFLSIPMRTNIK